MTTTSTLSYSKALAFTTLSIAATVATTVHAKTYYVETIARPAVVHPYYQQPTNSVHGSHSVTTTITTTTTTYTRPNSQVNYGSTVHGSANPVNGHCYPATQHGQSVSHRPQFDPVYGMRGGNNCYTSYQFTPQTYQPQRPHHHTRGHHNQQYQTIGYGHNAPATSMVDKHTQQ